VPWNVLDLNLSGVTFDKRFLQKLLFDRIPAHILRILLIHYRYQSSEQIIPQRPTLQLLVCQSDTYFNAQDLYLIIFYKTINRCKFLTIAGFQISVNNVTLVKVDHSCVS